jgi:hypothetical protein
LTESGAGQPSFFAPCFKEFFMNKFARFSVFGAAGAALANAAHADVPAAVTTAITTSGTDAGTIGAAVLVVLIGIAAFKFMRRAV